MFSRLDELDERGDHGDHDDGEDYDLEMLLHEIDVAQRIAGEEAGEDPEDAADDGKSFEFDEAHLGDAGDEGGEGADDRHKAGEDDRFAAIFFVEGMSFQQMFFVEKSGAFAAENRWADVVADGVVEQIAAVGGDAQEQRDQWQIDAAHGSDGADGEEQ